MAVKTTWTSGESVTATDMNSVGAAVNAATARANHTGTQPISSLATTGAASSSTYLRGDGAWATPAVGGGGGSTPLVNSMSFSATPTFDLAAYDVFQMTAVTAAITSATFTGGVNGKSYTFIFLANGAYGLTFGAGTRSIGVTIPATVAGKYLYLTGKWNSTDAKLHWLGAAKEA